MNNIASRCYMCGRILSENPTNKNECQCHDEHVIPNAIGGKLTARNILCKDCGGNLAKDNDANFTSIFTSFIILLQKAKILQHLDRNNNNNRSVVGEIFKETTFDSSIQKIKYKDGKAIPMKPSYDINEESKRVEVFANKQTIKEYIEHVKCKMAKNGKNVRSYTFVNHTDLMGEGFLGLYFTKGKTTFNKDFEDGLLKIAVEMALYFGIQREQLSGVLEIDARNGNSKYKRNAIIWPYVTVSLPDAVFENERYFMDPNYPSHMVKVFSEIDNVTGKKRLICYIDLFSTFQYYVLLSSDYKGKNVNFTYAQRLKTKYSPSLDELRQDDSSTLDIYLKELTIDRESIKGMPNDDVIKLIYNTKRKQGCKFNMYDSIQPIYDSIYNKIITIMTTEKEILGDGIDLLPSSCDIIKTMVKGYGLIPKDLNNICTLQCQAENFRSVVFQKYEKFMPESYSVICHELMDNYPALICEYTYSKFFHLSHYCFTKAGIGTE